MEQKNIRLAILQILFCMLAAVLFIRVYQLQIVNGEKYREDFELKITRNIPVPGIRGNIYDRNGNLLAGNRLVYHLVMVDNGTYRSGRERQLTLNGLVYRMREVLHKNGDEMNNEIKITVNAKGEYAYTVEGAALLRFRADVFGKADSADLSEEQAEMDAGEMVRYLAGDEKFGLYGTGGKAYTEEELGKYGLRKDYTPEEILDLVGIRYMLSLNVFQKYRSIVVSRDISQKTMVDILENCDSYQGIGVEEDWERVYRGGEAFSHIIGYVGNVSKEELDVLAAGNTDYSADSVVGKAGVEQAFEQHLQGRSGEKKIIVNNVGKIVGEEETVTEAVAGRNVYLSIDMDLQTEVYRMLEQRIADIVADHLVDAETFDKSRITDANEVRIPVYDVYYALVENHVVDLEAMALPEASELEKEMRRKLDGKKQEVKEWLEAGTAEDGSAYGQRAGEMREYEKFLVADSGILLEERLDREDTVYTLWQKGGEISLREFLYHALEKGWVDLEKTGPEREYYTSGEACGKIMDYLTGYLRDSREIEEIMFRYLLSEHGISEKDMCLLLYEQGVLGQDGDYAGLVQGKVTPFGFIEQKIRNLEITPAQLALDPCSGSAVVVQADTGKVLACVTYPGYDHNLLANQMDGAYYNRLLGDRSLPFYSRATQQLTAPGSTLKPVTVIAGLGEGVIIPGTSVDCDGIFDKVEPPLKCWNHAGHGEVGSAAAAIQNSCNDYLCEISYRLGKKTTGDYSEEQALLCLQKYASDFDLDKKSGIEIEETSPHVTDRYGIPSAIGQGTHNYATVQLARYANTLATRGKSYRLSLVRGMEDGNGTLVESAPVIQGKVELSEEIWDTVGEGMLLFAQNNTAFRDMGTGVAGKTGTAQESATRPDHSLFIGYAPQEDAEISVAVRIANGYGSSNAAQVGRDIFDYYFRGQRAK